MSDRLVITRTVPLLDYEIKRNGDGRTVVAYAATFGDLYEVRDADGHYDEVINAKAFNQALRLGADRSAQVFFNHGLDLWGCPSDRFSMPVGVPEEIRADARGLLTTTRYANTPLGDEVLQLWKDGAIRGQSFRGAVYQSRSKGQGPNGRPVIERIQLGLREYGPTPHPANDGAVLVAVRSQLLDDVRQHLDELTPEERRELSSLLAEPPALGDDTPQVTPDATAEAGDEAGEGQSLELLEMANAARRRR